MLVYLGAYILLGAATLVQRNRLLEWFREWNSQAAARGTPPIINNPGGFGFLLSKRAAQIFGQHPFLRGERRRFVMLAIGCLALFVAYPVVFLVLAVCLGLQ